MLRIASNLVCYAIKMQHSMLLSAWCRWTCHQASRLLSLQHGKMGHSSMACAWPAVASKERGPILTHPSKSNLYHSAAPSAPPCSLVYTLTSKLHPTASIHSKYFVLQTWLSSLDHSALGTKAAKAYTNLMQSHAAVKAGTLW